MTCTPSRTSRPRSHITAPLLMAVLLASGTTAAQTVTNGLGSPNYGRQLTIEQCGDCHRVAQDRTPKPPAMAEDTAVPDLTERMKDSAMTETALRAYLQTSHPVMPNVRLTREQTDDIVAYLLSLKGGAR